MVGSQLIEPFSQQTGYLLAGTSQLDLSVELTEFSDLRQDSESGFCGINASGIIQFSATVRKNNAY